jgi:apolipoprotein N-acyltransferase
LLALSFPPFKTWFFSYFGLAILLFLIFDSIRFREAFARGYVTMFVFNAIALYWIAGWESDDIFLKLGGVLTVLVHPFFFLIPILLTYLIKKSAGKIYALILFPLLWTGFEYWHNLTEFAFPWIEIGNTEVYNLNRIQYAEYSGVHGVTFIACIISVLIYLLVSKTYKREWKLTSSHAIVSTIVLILLIIIPNIVSGIILRSHSNNLYFSNSDSSKNINTVIVQPNIDPFKKWATENKDVIVTKYINGLNAGLKYNPDLFVLHETATPFNFLEDYNQNYSSRFFDFVNLNKKYVIMGIPHVAYFPDSLSAPEGVRIMSYSRKRYKHYNSAILLEPNKTKDEYQIHMKVKLVPFSENAPYNKQLPFMGKIIRWGVGISAWDMGDSLVVFNLNNNLLKKNSRFSTLICFESVFSDYVREAAKNGAEFLVIITNDGWFGNSSGPVQHERFAVLRAIENRKWIIRAAQTGISCFIDPLGNIYDEIPINSEGIISKNIIANNEVTFYSYHGDIIGIAGYYSCYLTLIAGIILHYVKRRKHAKRA